VQSYKYTHRPIQLSRMREYRVRLFRCTSEHYTENVRSIIFVKCSMLRTSHDFTTVRLNIRGFDTPRNVTGRTLHYPVTHVASSITEMEAEAPRREALPQSNRSTLRYHLNASLFACPTTPGTVHSNCS